MGAFYIRRFLAIFPTLLVVIVITFTIMHATPGGPFDVNPDSRTSGPGVQERLMRQYGLDKPWFFNPDATSKAWTGGQGPVAAIGAFFDAQFTSFIVNLAQGKLGPSFRFRGRQVEDVLFDPLTDGAPPWQSRVGTTIALGMIALVFALVVGFPMGLIAALNQNTWIDNVSLFIVTVGVGIPNFVLGLLLILLFASTLGWLKVLEDVSWQDWKGWVLPAFCLSIGTSAFLARLTRSTVLEVMRQDYVRTARAKGLVERVVIWKHIVRNALIPVVTFLGPAFAALTTGSFVIEYTFSVTGIGRLFVESIGRRDYGVIMGLTLIYAAFVAFANLGVDLVYGYLDPRIRLASK
ncbi:MAG: ABC transporter permease [Chloroflexi bacterium]|nr:ABC transporter permease [Chloroflexota bacterium]